MGILGENVSELLCHVVTIHLYHKVRWCQAQKRHYFPRQMLLIHGQSLIYALSISPTSLQDPPREDVYNVLAFARFYGR